MGPLTVTDCEMAHTHKNTNISDLQYGNQNCKTGKFKILHSQPIFLTMPN